jgi:NADH:ubiquinone oxidoreductase subunit F (NADH-binding)
MPSADAGAVKTAPVVAQIPHSLIYLRGLIIAAIAFTASQIYILFILIALSDEPGKQFPGVWCNWYKI